MTIRDWARCREARVTTQLDAARGGVTTEEVAFAAEREGVAAERLRELVAAGRAIVPANVRHASLEPAAIGSELRCKINANIGSSSAASDIAAELAKLQLSVELGADAVMDLSTGGDIDAIRRAIVERSPVPVGSVPVYNALASQPDLSRLSAGDFLGAVERHARDGIDFVTVHAGLLRRHLPLVRDRVTGIVSRGGAIMAQWMLVHEAENPFYARFDELLELCRGFDLSLSLGDGLRPGSGADANDAAQFGELEVLGELVRRARERGVQAMVEGPGHVPLHLIPENVERERNVCDGAPFYVLGPLVTDVAAGYDHIASAIGGALAALHGVAMLCYVTPREHLGLPDLEDVRAGVVAHRIAAHAADVALDRPGARARDLAMSRARYRFDWNEMFRLALDPATARRLRAERQSGCELPDDCCSMCGPQFCAMKLSRELEKPGSRRSG
ncbi:MAG: phosphomethylpyrimidine synthase ThiC [Deltaproteobacteria bacterium]|nr:phosphomethylpyrimidine synthase ThiC [Deltaproteobacteria bacterium]